MLCLSRNVADSAYNSNKPVNTSTPTCAIITWSGSVEPVLTVTVVTSIDVLTDLVHTADIGVNRAFINVCVTVGALPARVARASSVDVVAVGSVRDVTCAAHGAVSAVGGCVAAWVICE